MCDVRTLDKKQGSFKQYTSANAVKQDLVISAYKPNPTFEEKFRLTAGSEAGAWEFVRSHLRQIPVFVTKVGRAEVIAERQGYLLFDRMVAFHVQRGYGVPLSAAEFYAGIRQRFPERDGMFFLPEQVSEYDLKRVEVREVEQLELFVSDEKTQSNGFDGSWRAIQPSIRNCNRITCERPSVFGRNTSNHWSF